MKPLSLAGDKGFFWLDFTVYFVSSYAVSLTNNRKLKGHNPHNQRVDKRPFLLELFDV
nr:hypothetical protein [Listeria booriae]